MANDFRPNFNGGQPPKPTRLMVGLMLLQNLYGLSDEELVRAWVENPYWQYFCGYDFFSMENADRPIIDDQMEKANGQGKAGENSAANSEHRSQSEYGKT